MIPNPAKPIKNRKHERFCQLWAVSDNASESSRLVGSTTAYAMQLAQRPDLRARFDWLRAQRGIEPRYGTAVTVIEPPPEAIEPPPAELGDYELGRRVVRGIALESHNDLARLGAAKYLMESGKDSLRTDATFKVSVQELISRAARSPNATVRISAEMAETQFKILTQSPNLVGDRPAQGVLDCPVFVQSKTSVDNGGQKNRSSNVRFTVPKISRVSSVMQDQCSFNSHLTNIEDVESAQTTVDNEERAAEAGVAEACSVGVTPPSFSKFT